MGWYDLFARFYDKNLEHLYASQRIAAADALDLAPGQTVLDLPCGTGQSFDALAPRVGATGRVLGVDASAGMLARARTRAAQRGFEQVRLHQGDVHTLTLDALAAAAGRAVTVDRLHVFLGLTAFAGWEQDFAHLWSLLAPGGRAVIVDVHADPLGFQGHMVNLVARADIRRRAWEPLERVARDYTRSSLPSLPEHGGTLWLATGTKARE